MTPGALELRSESHHLDSILEAINERRRAVSATRDEAELFAGGDAWIEREIETAGRRLAVYGTLAPGESNHHLLEPLGGSWSRGIVRGTLHSEGWGATLGFPAMVWDPAGEAVEVHLLESPALETAWPRLDGFEGEAYLRILVPVEPRRTSPSAPPPARSELRVANLYALRAAPKA